MEPTTRKAATFSQGSAVVVNGRHQHLHSVSFVPQSPRAVLVFLPSTGESCGRYASLFKFLASHQIAVFALEQSPVIDDSLVDNSLYKHPNPELNVERISANAAERPAPSACSVQKYVDDVHHFVRGIARRLGDADVDYFLCGVFYGGLMAAHTAIEAGFPWRGLIMTSPDLSGPIGYLESITTNLSANLEKVRALMPRRPSFAMFRQKLMPKQLDHMGNNFSFISDPTTSPTENDEDFETDDMHLNAARELDHRKTSLKLPVLILNGKADAKKPRIKADRFVRQIGAKDKTVTEFKELYNSLGGDAPEVNTAVYEWIVSYLPTAMTPQDDAPDRPLTPMVRATSTNEVEAKTSPPIEPKHEETHEEKIFVAAATATAAVTTEALVAAAKTSEPDTVTRSTRLPSIAEATATA
ncbi:hypothetical protein SPRG_03025 [Saprolegnia parasitica CBS 223.65]|uniref:Serine aminopeptidase S33 domain-containing protein n=1 Tax=Saprolegnia parasitica (strain CBS 223.65) TaxID=695850 RepID=A0A067CTH6_SAPPC|nr:hypothetical protein SPRG_03025 [Saprolegnia parasitica CBS 223.65]KDO32550.1 hypothetical protein SPRG_03025 [Saprolegnia parasitica CBS 223.65]|eukprot:XP_012196996.1 hypothetical protein SPRG_03025 [Saprolegnia parasitica CBS 223.65]